MVSEKNILIEILRIISAFLIVWYHSSLIAGHAAAYSGLIILIIISLYLSIKSNSIGLRIRGRLKRIVTPWVIWFLIYGIGNIVLSNSFFSREQNYLVNVLVGTHIHLWYLPFMFFVLTLSSFLKSRISPALIAYLSFGAYLAWMLTVTIWRDWSLDAGPPIAQYIHAIGGVFIGLYFGVCSVLSKEIRLILIAIIYMSTIFSLNILGVGVPYLIGISAVLLAVNFNIKIPISDFILKISTLSYGIYLIHPIYIYLVQNIVSDIWIPITAYVLSVISIIVLKRMFPRYAKYAM